MHGEHGAIVVGRRPAGERVHRGEEVVDERGHLTTQVRRRDSGNPIGLFGL